MRQCLFDGTSDKAIVVIKNNNSKYVITEHECSDRFQLTLCQPNSYLAMRRIIKTPVWTVADQKAGRLPEVGCEVMVSPKTKATVTAVDSIQKVVAVQCDDESLDILQPCEILPIETEAERQQREREEWCNSAAKLLKNLEYSSTLTSIYDALLSGELKMPEVK